MIGRVLRGAGLSIVLIAAAAHGETSLTLVSEPGDPILGGATLFLTPSDGSFSISGNALGGVSVSFAGDNSRWSLDFADRVGSLLSPGLYLNAVRFATPYAGENGLSVATDGKSCKYVSGAFAVEEAAYSYPDVILAFRARFEQRCDHSTSALRGEVRFEVDRPLFVSSPLMRSAPWDEGLSFDVSVAVSGGGSARLFAVGLSPGAEFVDHGDNTGTFTWTPVGLDSAPGNVTFSAEDDRGGTDSVKTYLGRRGKTSLRLRSQPGDSMGGGEDFFYTLEGGVLQIFRNSYSGVTVQFSNEVFSPEPQRWRLEFAPPLSAPYFAGIYHDAVRFPFHDGGRPGLFVQGGDRDCDAVEGTFEVKQLYSRMPDSVEMFWATFEQHCEGAEPSLFGEIRYNADVDLELVAPLRISARPGEPLEFSVRAEHRRGGSARLSTWELPSGARFQDNADLTGTFSWTPGLDQLGTYFVDFSASSPDCESLKSSTRIDVEYCAGVELVGRWTGLRHSCATGNGRRPSSKCSLRGTLQLSNLSLRADSEPTRVDLLLSDDETAGPDDLLLSRAAVRRIPAWSSVVVALGARVPAGVAVEGKHVIAVIDATNVEPECDEPGNALPRALAPAESPSPRRGQGSRVTH